MLGLFPKERSLAGVWVGKTPKGNGVFGEKSFREGRERDSVLLWLKLGDSGR